MTPDIIDMARQAGWSYMELGMYNQHLKAFAKLVADKSAAKEREACAKVCDDMHAEYEGDDVQATWCASAIRARGQE